MGIKGLWIFAALPLVALILLGSTGRVHVATAHAAVMQDAGAAAAQPSPDPTQDPEGFGGLLLKAAQSKQWWLLLSLALMGAVAGVRYFAAKGRLGAKFEAFLESNVGTLVFVAASSLLGAMIAALMAGQAMTWSLFFAAIKVAAGAVFAFETGKATKTAIAGPPVAK